MERVCLRYCETASGLVRHAAADIKSHLPEKLAAAVPDLQPETDAVCHEDIDSIEQGMYEGDSTESSADINDELDQLASKARLLQRESDTACRDVDMEAIEQEIHLHNELDKHADQLGAARKQLDHCRQERSQLEVGPQINIPVWVLCMS